MKNYIYFFLVFIVLSCSPLKLKKNPPFKISKASFNYWTSGQSGQRGIRLTMNYESSKLINFEKVYFKNTVGNLDLYQHPDSTLLVGTILMSSRNDTQVLDVDPRKELKNPTPSIVKSPVKLKDNQALLVYLFKERQYYYVLQDIVETPADYYP